MFWQVGTEQANKPEDSENSDRGKEKFGVVEERESYTVISNDYFEWSSKWENTIVTQKSDHGVIPKSEQVQRVSNERGNPKVARNQRHQKELNDVEEEPDWEERANRDLRSRELVCGGFLEELCACTHVKAVPEFQLLSVSGLHKEALSPPAG